MRPRRIRRGELHRAGPAGHARPGFNAATANSPWRTRSGGGPTSRRSRLQCGHGEFAVENKSKAAHYDYSQLTLQCGHGEFAVENRCWPERPGPGAGCFNAATANSPWRTFDMIKKLSAEIMLQCGHGEFAVENLAGSSVMGGSW